MTDHGCQEFCTGKLLENEQCLLESMYFMMGVGRPTLPQTLPSREPLHFFLSKEASILEPSGKFMCDKNNTVQSPVITKAHPNSN